MSKPPYLETWTFGAVLDFLTTKRPRLATVTISGPDKPVALVIGSETHAQELHRRQADEDLPARAELAAAAPALARALLLAEWGDPNIPRCPCCDAPEESGHEADCPVDAALKQAGFPDQLSREAAVEWIENDPGAP